MKEICTFKFYCYLVVFISLAFVIFLNYYKDFSKDYFNISEWGNYLFAVPFSYCLFNLVSQRNFNPSKEILLIFTGVIIAILLNRNFTNSFWFQKLLVSSIGALITWILVK